MSLTPKLMDCLDKAISNTRSMAFEEMDSNQLKIFCRSIKNYTESAISILSESINNSKRQKNELEKAFLDTEQKIADEHSERRVTDKKLAKIKENIAAIQEKQEQLNSEMESLNKEINNKIRQIEEEQTKRGDAAVDWIPGVGFFGGLITGRFERMIPFHSVVSGIISALTDEKERLEEALDKKYREKNRLLSELEAEKVNECEVKKLQMEVNFRITNLENSLKELEEQKKMKANNLTILKTYVTELKLTKEKVQNLTDFDIQSLEHLQGDDDLLREMAREIMESTEDIKDKLSKAKALEY